jgi:hypothetical protein
MKAHLAWLRSSTATSGMSEYASNATFGLKISQWYTDNVPIQFQDLRSWWPIKTSVVLGSSQQLWLRRRATLILCGQCSPLPGRRRDIILNQIGRQRSKHSQPYGNADITGVPGWQKRYKLFWNQSYPSLGVDETCVLAEVSSHGDYQDTYQRV